MTAEERPDEAKADEDWVHVGDAPPAEAARDSAPPPDEEPKVYEGRKPVPPWKYSLNLGVIGLILMAAVYVFPEVRHFETPWDPAFPTAFVLLVFPVLSVLWGLIGVIGKQFAGDRGKAFAGLVFAAVTFALAYLIVSNEPPRTDNPPTPADERLQMTPEELQEWRSEKLRQR